jgi:SecD/SecF fusion protein
MDKNAMWKWLILIFFVMGSLSLVVKPGEKPLVQIPLGIDLVGGTSFTLQVNTNELRDQIEAQVETGQLDADKVQSKYSQRLPEAREQALEVIRNRIDGFGVANAAIYPEQEHRIVVELPGIDDETHSRVLNVVKSVARLTFQLVHEDNDALSEKLFAKGLAPENYVIATDIIKNGKATRGYRVDGNLDPDAFRSMDYRKRLRRFGDGGPPDALHEFMMMKEADDFGQPYYLPYYVERVIQLKGDNLANAEIGFSQIGEAYVNLRFDKEGTELFRDVTSDFAPDGEKNRGKPGRQLGIVLDGTLYSAPVLREAIYGGEAQITGGFTQEEAKQLVTVLRAGALPVGVELIKTLRIDPTLGKHSIENGVKAIAYSFLAVLLFMGIYYMASGMVANLALLLNMILLPLGMFLVGGFLGIFAGSGGGSWQQSIQLPVLTLPGIAGILLTIGMAVDANVLIFERMREEFRVGKRTWPAINAGYDRAFVTILDANITTFLTGVILFIFGSGPIRGFSITMCAGILVSMYSALVFTRLIFYGFARNAGDKTLKMMSIVGQTSLDFVGKRKIAAILSLALIIGTWVMLINKNVKDSSMIFSHEFVGGDAVTMSITSDPAKQPTDVEIKSALEAAGIALPVVQYQRSVEADLSYLKVTVPYEMGLLAEETVEKAFPDAGIHAGQIDEIGPQIGDELKWQAVKSVVISLIVMILYITWRFKFGFAIGAIVALAHDVLITIGVYCLLGKQISLITVAAVLTIVGYSINDTIVVFDRIREDLKMSKNKPFDQVANESINRTLSRTLLTSFTTLIVVLILMVFGNGDVYDFATTLLIGVLVGTYSSIFVATPVMLLWHRNKKPEISK